MKISIIIPVYNVEDYLPRCIKSVLKQSYYDFEVILVDDGSPDNCGIICDEYANKYDFISVIHKENGGLSSARNVGIDKAKGEYITFVDSDDIIHPDYLGVLYDATKNTESDIGFGKLFRFSDINIVSNNPIFNPKKTVISSIEMMKNFYNKESMSRYNSSCCKLYKKDLFEGIRFPEGRLFEDEFTTYKLYYKAKRIVSVEEDIYFYYFNENGITGTLSLEKYLDEYDAQMERIIFFKTKGLTDIHHLALLHYLDTAKWHMKKCRLDKKYLHNPRIKQFVRNYKLVFEESRKAKLISFIDNYDYYVLAHPEHTIFYRIIRKILVVFRKRN